MAPLGGEQVVRDVQQSRVDLVDAASSTRSSCSCGADPVKRCDACDLSYCAACAERRHQNGAFQRHTVVSIVRPTTTQLALGKECRVDSTIHTSSTQPSTDLHCDECLDTYATLRCDGCELHFCSPCADAVHRLGALRAHRDDQFVHLRPRHVVDEVPGTHATDVDKLLQDVVEYTSEKPHATMMTTRGLTLETTPTGSFLDGRCVHDDDVQDDPDQEKSPMPVIKTTNTSETESTSRDTYDLWANWSVRPLSERSSSIDDASQWRGLRSLSIDEKPASPPLDELPLSSITKSLRSLSFATNQPSDEQPEPPRRVHAQRPRSFSDYTSLGPTKLNDIWSRHELSIEEPTFDTPAMSPAPSPPPSVAPVLSSSSSSSSTYPPRITLELVHAFKTNFASRHVIIKSNFGGFEPGEVHDTLETLQGYGPIASFRDEFASDGVLFCTFFELKAAIGAVKLWFTHATSETNTISSSVVYFSLPYELPSDVNCATIVIQLSMGTPMASNEMRQLCAHYGEIASVLQNDLHASKYIVEYNDARDVAGAMTGLSCSFLGSGQVSVTRSHPPTLDVAKLQLFQEYVEGHTASGNRPKSFSTSTTMLTSPTSSASSPLSTSFFDSPITGFSVDHEPTTQAAPSGDSSRTSSPFVSGSYANAAVPTLHLESSPRLSPDPTSSWSTPPAARSIGARPRSSSAYASTSSSSSLLSDLNPPPRSLHTPPTTTAAPTSHSFHPAHSYHHHPLHQRVLMTAGVLPGRYAARSGSDPPAFRGSMSSSGRHDQGTGEYSLEMDKVLAGEDPRTTLMIRNIPNKYTQQMLLAEINQRHHGAYDFFYLPIDFKNKCNMGYAFINFIDATSIVAFVHDFDNQKWTNFNSEKVCAISYARLQGKQAMITRFQNSSLLDKHESYRPLVFYSSGPHRGEPEPFPSPKPFVHKKPLGLHPLHPPHGQYGVSQDDGYMPPQSGGRMYHHHHMAHHHHHHQQQLQHQATLLANAHMAAAAAAAAAVGLHGYGSESSGSGAFPSHFGTSAMRGGGMSSFHGHGSTRAASGSFSGGYAA